MSEYDDDDAFADMVIKQTAILIGKEAAKLRGELLEEKKAREKLQRSLNDLQSTVDGIQRQLMSQANDPKPPCNHQCEQVMARVFSTALLSVVHDQDPAPADPNPSFLATRMIPDYDQEDDEQPGPSTKRKLTADADQSASKRANTPIYLSVDDVPLPLREHIKPYSKGDNQAKNDLLNNVQRAFVKFKAAKSLEAGEGCSSMQAKHLIYEGIENGIWTSNFNPSETLSFEKYIQMRLKNERKLARRKSLLAGQEDLINACITSELEN